MTTFLAVLLSVALHVRQDPTGPDAGAPPAHRATRQPAQEGPDPVTGPESQSVRERSAWELFPNRLYFSYYLADPLTPRSGTKVMMPFRKEDNHKIENCLGSSRTVVRWFDEAEEWGFDVGIDGAVISRFDISEAWDLDAADYLFGFPLAYRHGAFAARLRVWHLTSHLGDEIISREGRDAIRYHKEEISLAVSLDWPRRLRTYLDLGYGAYIGTPNERWKAQAGAEWVGGLFAEGWPRPYVAVDLKWREETDWDTAVTFQGGFFVVPGVSHDEMGLRVFMELYAGRAAQTQFPDERDLYWAWGFAAVF